MSIIKVKKLSFEYDRIILNKISFDVDEGLFISLLGINGAGKSTLLKNLNRLLKPSEGKILIDGEDLFSIKKKELAQKMAYVNQYNTAGVNTVFDNILVGRCPHIRNDACSNDYEIVEEIIKAMKLEKYALRNTDTLSGGEFQKVVMARALAQEPKILLLDEPTSNLDIKNQLDVLNLVKDYCTTRHISVIMSIHDINLALKFSDRYLLLKDGIIKDYGDNSIINTENIKSVYDIDAEIISHRGRKILIT
ncbi:ABC transporter ATP-binding protein [Microaceticoccus formicicus]|uniref:ABC transporter ATP-binding protein n=1 Tax=Microaceticoccus formicicus TaxID=3118105 RepID=UPI003CD00E06|nr:ABC transporter ATP-binding protein [Peptoniphilaceae bacterium AMB_02]